MRIKSGVVIFVSLFSFAFTVDPIGINYKHKSLLKALKKVNVTDMSVIEEIVIPDSIKSSKRISGKYFLINDTNVRRYRYIYVGRVSSCRSGGCSFSNEIPQEDSSEYFDYYILFDENKSVQDLKIFNYQATHGHEIAVKGWLKQFIGHHSSESLQIGKNIDAISGATISVYAITADIAIKTEILNDIWFN